MHTIEEHSIQEISGYPADFASGMLGESLFLMVFYHKIMDTSNMNRRSR